VFVAIGLTLVCGGLPADPASGQPAEEELLDGRSLEGWQVVDRGEFARHGEVLVNDGILVIGAGDPATGIRRVKPWTHREYELSFEARRVAGNDFFCGLTFPVGDESLTLILGGWSGWVVGLSCLDGDYAVDNETCTVVRFQQERWYRVRLRVTRDDVAVWVDGQQVIQLKTGRHRLAASAEMEPCLPLGLATWNTTGQLRQLRVRPLNRKVRD
jgi:hypothetical protein